MRTAPAKRGQAEVDAPSSTAAHARSRMVRTLRSIAEAIFFGPEGPPPAPRLDWLAQEAQDFLWHAGGRTRFLIRLCLLVVSVLAPLSVMRFPPLSRLPLRDRTLALARFEKSWLAPPLFAIKALLSLLYYEHPDAAREIGFDSRCRLPVADGA